ncbi:yippee putative zinc-binding protein [Dictyocaulus viviparus]|uniref:Protein yippee-like n=1 Tax=Dictyocaulus viviparus TaxID=29172 RepID=A0A0D8XVK0_DICVI|nr:yippee putative zinc-binding protein [Dictyocaulus viviparus]
MPRIFLEHWGGRRTFSCLRCGTYLSNRKEIISARVNGHIGKAYLFRRVANIRQGVPIIHRLITGYHIVRDVFCILCDTKLGWVYEFIQASAERYKEGKFVIDRRLVQEIEVVNNKLAEYLFDRDDAATEAEVPDTMKIDKTY